VLPRTYLIDLLARKGVALVDSFLVPLEPGQTEVFCFRRS
jgi:hypothetical protein